MMNTLTLAELLCAMAVVYGVATYRDHDKDAWVANSIRNVLRRPTPVGTSSWPFHRYGTERSTRLSAFKVKDCDVKNSAARLVNFFLGPDPVKLPGDITVGFTLDVYKTATSGLHTSVVLNKKNDEGKWEELPCVAQIGSCTYSDLCDILNMIPSCPGPFSTSGVPCKCPFNQGNYTLPKTDFEVDLSILPSGDFWGVVNITLTDSPGICFEIWASLE